MIKSFSTSSMNSSKLFLWYILTGYGMTPFNILSIYYRKLKACFLLKNIFKLSEKSLNFKVDVNLTPPFTSPLIINSIDIFLKRNHRIIFIYNKVFFRL